MRSLSHGGREQAITPIAQTSPILGVSRATLPLSDVEELPTIRSEL
jgi:hypothetical protein